MPYNHLHSKIVSIAASQTLSSVLSLEGLFSMVGIVLPPSWTACNITVEGSMDERDAADTAWVPTTWYSMYDSSSNPVTIEANAASRGLMLSQDVLMAAKHLRFTCSVAQAAARVVTIIFRSVG